ncbi:hypothetical protein ACIRRI_52590 [Streptomyces mirabilis]|uniref:hypothetical protein n=1 Tax=Streptomyces mirabilis TaxID=68239 RepID=UPI00382B8170
MAHCNNGRFTRQKKETSVTPQKRNLRVSGAVSAAGLTLGACLLTGVIKPDIAGALATVAGTTVTCVVLLTRRPSPASAGPDQDGPVSLDK